MCVPKLLFKAETIMLTSLPILSFNIFSVNGVPSFSRIHYQLSYVFSGPCGFLSLPPSLHIHTIFVIGAPLEGLYSWKGQGQLGR